MKARLTITAVVLTLCAPAIAQDKNDWQSWPLADKFTIGLDAFFPSLNTRVRIDASDDSSGTTIDFEQNLGMSDTESLPSVSASWRFAKKHQLTLDVFALDRSGSSITATDIKIGDETITVNLPVSSFFDMQITSVGYSYSLLFDEKKELAIGVGLSVQDIQFGLVGNTGAGIIEAGSGITAPVPTLGLSGGYAFTEKWIGKAGIAFLSFDLSVTEEDQVSGDVRTGFVSIQHNTFEHIHFALSYRHYDLRIDWNDSGLVTTVGYEYRGPVLSVTGAF